MTAANFALHATVLLPIWSFWVVSGLKKLGAVVQHVSYPKTVRLLLFCINAKGKGAIRLPLKGANGDKCAVVVQLDWD